jgi:hypothetical protein
MARNARLYASSIDRHAAMGSGCGSGSKMVALGDGRFRFGDADHSPERLQFDTIVNGEAWRVTWSGNAFYRFFTP